MSSIEKPNLLIVSAHAADFVWRSGGTIARYVEAGSTAHVVCASVGQRGESIRLWENGATSEAQIIEMRRKESIEASEVLGATVEFLDLDDHPMLYGRDAVIVLFLWHATLRILLLLHDFGIRTGPVSALIGNGLALLCTLAAAYLLSL